MAKTCLNVNCHQYNMVYESFTYCCSCGRELTKVGPCTCGYDLGLMKFCPMCGKKNERLKNDTEDKGGQDKV